MSGCAAGPPSFSRASGSTAPFKVRTLSFPQQGGTLAMIPATYRQGTPNPWVLYLHGFNQDANTLLSGGYGEVEAELVESGFVVIGMTNTTQNCYGNAQCDLDVAAVSELYQSTLSLQTQPYVLADSMGGFTVLNAISARAIVPRAVVGWCINTDLAWDYVSGGGGCSTDGRLRYLRGPSLCRGDGGLRSHAPGQFDIRGDSIRAVEQLCRYGRIQSSEYRSLRRHDQSGRRERSSAYFLRRASGREQLRSRRSRHFFPYALMRLRLLTPSGPQWLSRQKRWRGHARPPRVQGACQMRRGLKRS